MFSKYHQPVEKLRGWTFCSLLVARYCLLIARYFLLVARYFLLDAGYFLFIARYFLLIARYYLFVARYFLLVVRYFLLVARYVLHHFDVFNTIYGHVFIYFYVLEESGVVSRKRSMKKVCLNIPQISQEITESGTDAFLWIFWNL